MAVRLAADLRPSADGSAVRTSLVAGQLQASHTYTYTYIHTNVYSENESEALTQDASVPIAVA